MEKRWSQPTIRERRWRNRGDGGFGQEAIGAWHEGESQKHPPYLFKRKLTNNVRRAIARGPRPLWEGAPDGGRPAVRRDQGAAARLAPGTADRHRAHAQARPPDPAGFRLGPPRG